MIDLGDMASVLYLVTAAASLAAARAALATKDVRGGRFWCFVAAFFLGIMALRMIGAEQIAHDTLRSWSVSEGAYTDRRAWQGPLAVLAILMLAAVLAVFVRLATSRRADAATWTFRMGLGGVLVMTGLIAIRLISFHGTDQLLYKGPHLNWVVDIGATLTSLAGATRFIRAFRLIRKDRAASRRPG